MIKSTFLSFNSLLFLAFALCTSTAVAPPPALAETCMTDSLMMVYEPVETAKPRPNKATHKVTVANHKSTIHKPQANSIQALKPSAVKQVAVKESQSKTKVDGADGFVEPKTDDVSVRKPIVPTNSLSSTEISHAALVQR